VNDVIFPSGVLPEIDGGDVAWVDREQMRAIDRITIDEFCVELAQMMENAGRHLATVALADPAHRTFAVYVGSGGNAGGGLVAARHLRNAGVEVTVVAALPPARLDAVTAHQFDIVRRMAIDVATDPVTADVGIDALVGYGLRGGLRGDIGRLAAALGRHSGRVLSLDLPTGVDATTGVVDPAAVSADATLTLCLPKVGLRANANVGALLLADISVPGEVVERVTGQRAPSFRRGPIVRVGHSGGVS
jgi:NAD(P)H-hydrate epimerase